MTKDVRDRKRLGVASRWSALASNLGLHPEDRVDDSPLFPASHRIAKDDEDKEKDGQAARSISTG